MFVVQNLIQEYWWGCLVGHPYIASLWLGFSICEALAPKRVLHRSLALFCLLPGYFQAFENSVNKGGSKVPLLFTRPCRVWRGSMLYKAFCLVYHGSHSNNRKHKYNNLCLSELIHAYRRKYGYQGQFHKHVYTQHLRGQGQNSQNFLGKFVRFSVTLDLKILRL